MRHHINTTWAKVLLALVIGYILQFPAKLIEDAVIGWINHRIAGRHQVLIPWVEKLLTILIQWVAPFTAAILLIWVAITLDRRQRATTKGESNA